MSWTHGTRAGHRNREKNSSVIEASVSAVVLDLLYCRLGAHLLLLMEIVFFGA